MRNACRSKYAHIKFCLVSEAEASSIYLQQNHTHYSIIELNIVVVSASVTRPEVLIEILL